MYRMILFFVLLFPVVCQAQVSIEITDVETSGYMMGTYKCHWAYVKATIEASGIPEGNEDYSAKLDIPVIVAYNFETEEPIWGYHTLTSGPIENGTHVYHFGEWGGAASGHFEAAFFTLSLEPSAMLSWFNVPRFDADMVYEDCLLEPVELGIIPVGEEWEFDITIDHHYIPGVNPPPWIGDVFSSLQHSALR